VLPLVVRAGAGSVRDSLSVLDQLLAGAGPEGLTYERTVALLGYTDDSLLDEMVDALAAGDGAAAFGTVDRVVQGGHDPRRFAADLLDRLRDLIILGAVPGAGRTGLLDAPADRLEKMADQAGRFGQADLARSAEILSDGLIQMRGTTSPRLLLALMVAQILLPGASTGEKALATRLERLERQLEGLASGGGPAPRPGTAPAPGTAPGTGTATAAGSASAAGTVVAPGTQRAAGRPSGQPAPPGAVPAHDAPAEEDTPARGNQGGAREASRRAGERPAPPADPPAGRPAPVGAAKAGSAGAGSTPAGRAGSAPAGSAHAGAAQAGAASVGAAQAPARAAASPRPGVIDTEALRQRWPEVLEAVKGERRVTGILLNSASVASLEGGVLTLAFNREGEAKGFSTSGHDQDLTGVLAAMLGLNVRVRALAGTAAGPGGGRAAPADPAAPGGGTRDRTGTHSAPRRATHGRDDSPDGPGTAPGGSTSGSVAPGGQGAAKGGPGSSPEGAGSARRAPAAAPARPTGRETAVPDAPPPAADDDEEWPDDAGPARGESGPTGMELIERQLGGTVIEEIEEP